MERNFLLLALFLSPFYGSNTFWFSYKSVTSNNILVEEQKNIAPLMVSYRGKILSTCKVTINSKTSETSLQKLNKNFDKILPCFYHSSVLLSSRTIISKNKTSDIVEIVIAPVRFIVDFKDDFANISILKKE